MEPDPRMLYLALALLREMSRHNLDTSRDIARLMLMRQLADSMTDEQKADVTETVAVANRIC